MYSAARERGGVRDWPGDGRPTANPQRSGSTLGPSEIARHPPALVTRTGYCPSGLREPLVAAPPRHPPPLARNKKSPVCFLQERCSSNTALPHSNLGVGLSPRLPQGGAAMGRNAVYSQPPSTHLGSKTPSGKKHPAAAHLLRGAQCRRA